MRRPWRRSSLHNSRGTPISSTPKVKPSCAAGDTNGAMSSFKRAYAACAEFRADLVALSRRTQRREIFHRSSRGIAGSRCTRPA